MTLTSEDLLAISQLLDTKLKTEIQAGLRPLKEEVQDLKEEVQDLKEEVQDLKDEVQDLKGNIRKIELHLENITDKNIQILAENYLPAAQRYAKEVEKMEAIQQDIDVLKGVVSKHSEQLQKIS